MKPRFLILVAVLMLFAAACSGDPEPETTEAPTTTPATAAPATQAPATDAPETAPPETTPAEHDEDEARVLGAVVGTMTVDGDPSDWAGVDGIAVMLEPIEGKPEVPHQATAKVAYDDEFVYVLMTVDDDYDWNADDLHLTAAPSVMWAIDPAAGAHMGVEEHDGEGPSLGMVDIWHWELQCDAGVEQGGRVSDAGEGNAPGNDDACNFDDEWSTDPETREDDNGDGAENSLLGVFTHSAQTTGADGTWYFEMSRPLDTGDAGDATFAAGSDMLMALAYWDADSTAEGWDDDDHVISSNQGWITVTFE